MNDLQKFQQRKGAIFGNFFPAIQQLGDPLLAFDSAKSRCALFDLAGLGMLDVTGKDVHDLLHRMSMNEMRKMQRGDIVINALNNAKGKLVDVFFQIKKDNGYRLITSHGQGEAVAAWLDRYIFVEQVVCENRSGQLSSFLLTGPETPAVLGLESIPKSAFELTIAGAPVECLPVSRLCPQGLLLIVEAEQALHVYQSLAAHENCTLAGAEAFDMLRVEQAVPLFGREFGAEDTNPYEAGLQDFIDYNKGCYIGQEVIARLDTYDKVKFEYATLALDGPPVADVPAAILDGEKEIGVLTTSAADPENSTASRAIGRIRRKALQEKNAFTVLSGEKTLQATVLSSTLSKASS